MNGVSRMVILRSRSLDKVRVAMMAGTEQPKPMSMGTKLRPERPIRRSSLIHHEGHAGHIAGVLQDGQEEEQRDDDGQKAQHAAHAGKDAVDDKAVHHRVDAVGGQRLVSRRWSAASMPSVSRSDSARADDAEGQPEHQRHNADKAGQGGVLAGQDACP